VVDDFATGAPFVVAVGDAGDALGHRRRVSICPNPPCTKGSGGPEPDRPKAFTAG
jgi:hypothetical protein